MERARGKAAPPARRPLQAEVRRYRGRVALFVNGRVRQPAFYSLTDYPGGRWTWEEMPRRNLTVFAQAGFSLFQVDLMLEHLWTSARAFDIGPARRQLAGVLDIDPRAGIVIRLHTNAPGWWNRAHPEECVQYADGPIDSPPTRGIERPLDRDLERSRRQSLASERWRREAGARVAELCRRLSRTPEGRSLLGVHIANGVFGEWGYFGFIQHEPDTGPAMTACFRRWLGERYGSDAALQAAWDDATASVQNAEVPGVAPREQTADGVFRDPRREQRVIDYNLCQQAAVVESLLDHCRIVKESWPRPILTGVFYGYLFSQFGRQAAGGHLPVERVLSSPYVDYLSGPQTYQPYSREIGGTGMSRSLVDSCALHGKLWLDEMDQPTHLGSVADKSFSCTLPDAVSLLRRNVLHPLLRGQGLWYYDFGPRFSSGWWDDPTLMAEIRRLKAVFDGRLRTPYESPADVLFVGDATVFNATGAREADPVSEPALDECAAAMYHSGVSFHMVYLCDLELVDWSRYRCVVLANTWQLSASQRRSLLDVVAADGRHVLWVYAPGYSDGSRLSTDLIAETIGMGVKPIQIAGPPSIPIPSPSGPSETLAVRGSVTPLFSARDPSAEVIACFQGTDIPGVSRARRRTHTAWFCSLPPAAAGLLRRIFRESGAHVWCDSGDMLVAGWGLLCLHTLDGGERKVTLPGGGTVQIVLPPRSTTLLDTGSGEVLIPG